MSSSTVRKSISDFSLTTLYLKRVFDYLRLLFTASPTSFRSDAFVASATTSGTYDNILVTLLGEHSGEVDRINQTLPSINNPLFSTKLVRDGTTILGATTPRKTPGRGVTVSGPDAKYTLAIRSGRMKRIPLYNSGFSIDISQPDMTMLNTFLNKAHDDTNSYGRQFGAYFFYFNDLVIKEAIVELISPLILNSTLKGWNRGNTLMRSIKLVDLKLIMNTLAALMHSDGYEFTHICTNQDAKCTHHEDLLIDLNKLARHDFRKLPEACIQHMTRKEEVTPAQLTEYHTKLGFDGREIRFGQWGFTLQVPSLLDYLEYGKIYNGSLLSSTFADDASAIKRAVLISYYRIYTPFISKLTFYDTNGAVDTITTDREAISDELAHIQEIDEESKLAEDMNKFISDTEISYICYPATPCPVCGHVPGSGYHTVDPERAFFIQSLLRLRRWLQTKNAKTTSQE